MDRKLIDYLPPVVRVMRESRAITDGQQEVISAAWDATDAVFNDQFIDDATLNGIRRWEKLLDIIPKGTDSLETRRFIIKTRLSEYMPYTLRTLRRYLESLCGVNGYRLNIERGGYIISVMIRARASDAWESVVELLQRVLPANLHIDLTIEENMAGSWFTCGEMMAGEGVNI